MSFRDSCSERLAELHAVCTVAEFNREQGMVKARNVEGSPVIVAVTLIEALGTDGILEPVEVVLDHHTTICVSPVTNTIPEPRTETYTWRYYPGRPSLRIPLLESALPENENEEYTLREGVKHTNPFHARVTAEGSGILDHPAPPLMPFLNVCVFDSIKIKNLDPDVTIQVVGYNIEQEYPGWTRKSWAYN